MKKICYCTTIPLTMEAFVLKSIDYIHEHTDWDISLVCSYEEKFAASLPDYVHYYPINMKRGIGLDGFKVIREMKKLFRSKQFDLIQYSTPNASFYASIAARSAHVPVRLYCQWGMAFVGFTGLKRLVLKEMEKRICRNSTQIEPDSKSNLEFAHAQGLYSADKSSVIWNGSACGIDTRKFDITRKEEFRKEIRARYRIPEDAFVYIFVGRIKRDKGINELLAAYRRLCDGHPSYLFLLGGKEDDGLINQELYEWSLAQETVIYTGQTPVVEQYLAASDCFVLPSYREGFGMGVVEAEAMGLPVIITDIPGPINGMINGETGWVVKKQHSGELENAMLRLYQDHDMCERFGRAGHRFAVDRFEQRQFFGHLLEDRKKLLHLH